MYTGFCSRSKMLCVFAVSLLVLTVSGHPEYRNNESHHAKRAIVTEVSTKPTPTGTIYLTHHNDMVMIVLQDGCYEYTPSRHEYHELRNHQTRAEAERLLLKKVAMATDIHEIDHHSIDKTSSEILNACSDLPIFRWTVSQ